MCGGTDKKLLILRTEKAIVDKEKKRQFYDGG